LILKRRDFVESYYTIGTNVHINVGDVWETFNKYGHITLPSL